MMRDTRPASAISIAREKELWLLILLGSLYFYRPLLLGETFFLREILAYLLPQKSLLADALHAGSLPLWDSFLHGGFPYLHNINNTPFHPSNLLYLVLPSLRACSYIIVGHIMLSCVATYFLARTLRLNPVSSAIAGLIYGYCGYTLSYTNLTAAFMALPLMPLSLMTWHRYLAQRTFRWFAATTVICCIRVFSGAPEANIVGMLFLLGWGLLYPYPAASYRKRVLAWVWMAALTIGLAAIQIVPTLEMMQLSARGGTLSYDEFSHWSLYPRRLPQLIIPNFLGYIDTLVPPYWGGKAAPYNPPHYIANIYFGLATLLLAGLGALLPTSFTRLPRRIRYALACVAAGGFVLSLGRYLPGFYWMYRVVPLISLFRFPIKFLSFSILPVAILAGCAANALSHPACSRTQPSCRSIFMGFWGLAICLAAGLFAVTVGFFWSETFAHGFDMLFFQQASPEITGHLQRLLLHAFLMFTCFLGIVAARNVLRRPWPQWLLMGMVAADLLLAGARLNPTASPTFLTDTPPIVAMVRQHLDDGRLYRTPDPVVMTMQVPSPDLIWMYRRGLEILSGYRATFYHIPIIFHRGLSLAPIRQQQMRHLLAALPWERRLPMLSAGAVTVIVTTEELHLDGVRRVDNVPAITPKPLFLYRNDRAVSRVECATQWTHADRPRDALLAITQADFDPRTQVVLEEPAASLFEPRPEASTAAHLPAPPATPCPAAQIELLRTSPEAAELTVSTACDSYLVFSEPWHPGWRVRIDDRPAVIHRANYVFSAVFLPAGEHRVTRRYRPKSLLIGAMLSGLSCCALFVGGWRWRHSPDVDEKEQKS